MRKIATSEKFDEKKEERYFKETFELLAKTTKDNSFRRYDDVKGRFVGGFLVSAFEMVALGVGYNLDFIRNQQIDIENKVKGMWKTQELTKKADKNASARISKVIPLGRRLFKP
jgi:alpha-acetolactate decarboxylase